MAEHLPAEVKLISRHQLIQIVQALILKLLDYIQANTNTGTPAIIVILLFKNCSLFQVLK